MSLFEWLLVTSALLCSLVAGFLFAYAIVVMPGIRVLGDREFIQAFQVTDRIIQNNQPVFLLVWIGSAVALIACAVSGYSGLQGFDQALLVVATVAYLLGVQTSTIVIHLPLNNRLQSIDLDTLTDEELLTARAAGESR